MAPTWGPEEPATPEIKIICNGVKSNVETELKRKFSEFVAIKFIYQVPEKIEYIIKVVAGYSDCIHVKVSQDLPFRGGKVQFVKCQMRAEGDPIEPF